jgi:hypothetical protein
MRVRSHRQYLEWDPKPGLALVVKVVMSCSANPLSPLFRIRFNSKRFIVSLVQKGMLDMFQGSINILRRVRDATTS